MAGFHADRCVGGAFILDSGEHSLRAVPALPVREHLQVLEDLTMKRRWQHSWRAAGRATEGTTRSQSKRPPMVPIEGTRPDCLARLTNAHVVNRPWVPWSGWMIVLAGGAVADGHAQGVDDQRRGLDGSIDQRGRATRMIDGQETVGPPCVESTTMANSQCAASTAAEGIGSSASIRAVPTPTPARHRGPGRSPPRRRLPAMITIVEMINADCSGGSLADQSSVPSPRGLPLKCSASTGTRCKRSSPPAPEPPHPRNRTKDLDPLFRRRVFSEMGYYNNVPDLTNHGESDEREERQCRVVNKLCQQFPPPMSL